VVGIEKVLPTWSDLDVFMRLLPRSSTAERMNPYTSMWTGVSADDGPQDVHVVLVDNGRTHVLESAEDRQGLRCIRCSACLNVCPVYEQVGGHAYGSVYPGPIGAVLTPALRGTTTKLDQSLPFASSLCGACFDACPVRIDIPRMLVSLRTRIVDQHRGGMPTAEAVGMRGAEWLFGKSGRLVLAQQGVTLAAKALRGRSIGALPWPAPGPLRAWTGGRDAPSLPRESFRQWWQRTHGGDR
jgi:L-lactate dehydrogenase complex protein LldF